jgi:hypothetical protein
LPIGLPTMVAQSVFLSTWNNRREITDIEKKNYLKEIKVSLKKIQYYFFYFRIRLVVQ